MLITDGVFSMDGDVARSTSCTRCATIWRHHDGGRRARRRRLGRGGRGIVDHFGLHGKFDLEIGTLSKAFGVVGGVIAGKKLVVDWIRQRARPFLFSSAVTPAATAACLAGG